MRLDGAEEVFCYKPHGFAMGYGLRHSGLYNGYHADTRISRSESVVSVEPELALAIACAGAIGLFEDCTEICVWREVCRGLPAEILDQYRNIIPGIVERIRVHGGDRQLKEMYFSMVLPVVAAMDAGEMEIAGWLCARTMEKLEKTYG